MGRPGRVTDSPLRSGRAPDQELGVTPKQRKLLTARGRVLSSEALAGNRRGTVLCRGGGETGEVVSLYGGADLPMACGGGKVGEGQFAQGDG